MNGFSALDWLELAERHADLSADAVTLAVFVADGFTGLNNPTPLGALDALRAADFDNFAQCNAAVNELKAAGMLSGRGKEHRPFIFRHPASQLGGGAR